jgi:acyl carrier protein
MGIDGIPLNPNGKVDRKALPKPDIIPGESFVAPGNEIEEKMAAIWSEVLGIEKDKISVDANFFDSGGHSLKVMVMIARIHKVFNFKLELVQVFRSPTIRGIALLIEALDWVNSGDKTESACDIDMDRENEEIIL